MLPKRSSRTRPNVQFTVHGDGPLRAQLEEQIKSAHLSHQMQLAGSFKRNQLAGIMRCADLFVLPSITEGFPLAIVEAMAWGRPIVATKVGGIPELLDDGATALLCPPRDSEGSALAVLSLLGNPEHAQTLGRAARQAYERGSFRPECVVEQFREVYLQALQMC